MTPADLQRIRVRAPAIVCPRCSRALNGISGNGIPKAGDVNVCFYCLAVMIFEEGNGFPCRLATQAEIAELAQQLDPEDAELVLRCANRETPS